MFNNLMSYSKEEFKVMINQCKFNILQVCMRHIQIIISLVLIILQIKVTLPLHLSLIPQQINSHKLHKLLVNHSNNNNSSNLFY